MDSDGLKLAISMKRPGASDVTQISKRHAKKAAKKLQKKKCSYIYCIGPLYSNASLQVEKKIYPGNVEFRRYDAIDLFSICTRVWAPSMWTAPRWETPKFSKNDQKCFLLCYTKWVVLPWNVFTDFESVDCDWFCSNDCFLTPQTEFLTSEMAVLPRRNKACKYINTSSTGLI